MDLKSDTWEVIKSYFEETNIIKHQLDSYNFFIHNLIPKATQQFNPIQINIVEWGWISTITMQQREFSIHRIKKINCVFYSLSLPNIYKSESILTATETTQNNSQTGSSTLQMLGLSGMGNTNISLIVFSCNSTQIKAQANFLKMLRFLY